MMTDTPDPGLTDLIAAALVRCSPTLTDDFEMLPHHRKEAWRVRARELVLVVEQHTNGRMAELRDVKAERNELKAIVVRVRAVTEDLVQNIADDEKTLRSPNVSVGEAQELPAVINVQKIYLKDLRAALEGEQQ